MRWSNLILSISGPQDRAVLLLYCETSQEALRKWCSVDRKRNLQYMGGGMVKFGAGLKDCGKTAAMWLRFGQIVYTDMR